MADTMARKRAGDGASRAKSGRPSKKQKRLQQYHSDSEEDAVQDFQAVNLLDSDDENLQDAQVDDGASSDSNDDSDASGADDSIRTKKKAKQRPPQDVPSDPEDESSDLDSSNPDNMDDSTETPIAKSKSKRNDPTAFAASISKILNTKLSTTRRSDPVLARSAEAHEASRRVLDSSLDTKARKQLRQQKRLALEKGRVRDVLAPAQEPDVVDAATGEVKAGAEGDTAAGIREAEKRLKRIARSGVTRLFNAVRAAQVKAAEAERAGKTEGVVGMGRREEKVTEMSKKGFLDLVASGGGKLKKGALEEG